MKNKQKFIGLYKFVLTFFEVRKKSCKIKKVVSLGSCKIAKLF